MSNSFCIHRWLHKHCKFKVLRHRPTKYHHQCWSKYGIMSTRKKQTTTIFIYYPCPSITSSFIPQPTTHLPVTSGVISQYLRCNFLGMNVYYDILIGSYLSLNVSTVEGRRTTRNKGTTGDDLESNFPIFTVKFARNYGRTSRHKSEQSM